MSFMHPPANLFNVFLLATLAVFFQTAEPLRAGSETNVLAIQSVKVNGVSMPITRKGEARLGAFPRNILFNFGPAAHARRPPIRLRYKLDGYDNAWHEGGGEMYLTVRFYNAAGDQVAQQNFPVDGDSAGWKGNLQNSSLTHRRETVVVPPQASRLMIVISSAGPPATVGIYVVDQLVVSRFATNSEPEVLLRSPFFSFQKDDAGSSTLKNWVRDGISPSMAKVVELGPDSTTKAFAILDNDPKGHAEWHNFLPGAPRVNPGDHLVVEWNEMYSMGVGDIRRAGYGSLPTGHYQFQVAEYTATGTPTGVEASLNVFVPPPFWQEPWFWGVIFLAVLLVIIAAVRAGIRRKLRQEMLRLENQRLLGQERLRISHDIHDDLGARVTQISLLSAVASNNQNFPGSAREDFDKVSRMCRDLVSALYETVWAVNPENDNLDALGNYLCQMVNQLCEQTRLRCRLHITDLPQAVQISSQTRHNIVMAVKEAIHNVIKHSRASEVTVHAAFEKELLSVSIQDNGGGFQAADNSLGNGLTNMRRRLTDIGGTCLIESSPGQGTLIILRVIIKPAG